MARFGKMHGRRKLAAVIMLAGAACTLAVAMSPNMAANAQEGGATSVSADSDGNVPVQTVCFGVAQGVATDQYVDEQQYAFDEPFVAEQQYTSDQYAGDSVGDSQYGADQYAGAQYATDPYSSETLGVYTWYNDGFTTYGTISIDDCALAAMGAGPQDRERVLAHERGHANGITHSGDPNDIMNPIVSITGS